MVMPENLVRFWRDFTENWVAVAALATVGVILLLALSAPLIAPQNPYDLARLVLADARRPPGYVGAGGFTHWLGTDAQGRDLLSAILYGLRISIQVGLIAGVVAFVLGASLGTMAAFFGGRTEAFIMRFIDLQLSFPAILLALVLAALLGQGKWQIIAALVTAQYAYFARTAHGAASAERPKEYVAAALSIPLPASRVIFRHILPNILAPVLVAITISIGTAILVESGVSFLGLGVQPPTASWGKELRVGFTYLEAAPLFQPGDSIPSRGATFPNVPSPRLR